ncbi:8-amino-7-oxononanoate synthase [Veillonella caviae]|uniref:8-amino-7-oxononanoate synthase n=1 Tax=Veillonella caviae TaxID=248316 RepID=UPI002A908DD9|nr:8-amino-7-oxononanoate synthase [Veillonella caviae]MDY5409598.1 8-amino-7-oxononanoate synthase [Veillonella caviae]
MNYDIYFKTKLEEKHKENNLRSLKSYTPINAVTVRWDGKDYLMMASNNYLGLTHHPQVQQAAVDASKRYGTGSGGARLTSGTFPLFTELEQELARCKGTESALVFNTGYMANVGTISAIANKEWVIVSDELNHASIIDGCRLSGATIERYKHKDVEEVEFLLQKYRGARILLITDSVFSMDGDIAPLHDLQRLSRDYHALLMVDDAHATGVIGHGIADYYDIHDVDIQLGTLSKALGSVGGFVAASRNIIQYLINYSRSFIFSTALSPADIGAALAALRIIETDRTLISKLQDNSRYMASKLIELGIPCDDETPIFPIVIGDNEKTLRAAMELQDKGIIITAIRPPTVPIGESRLRLTVTAAHSREQLDYVASALDETLQAIL